METELKEEKIVIKQHFSVKNFLKNKYRICLAVITALIMLFILTMTFVINTENDNAFSDSGYDGDYSMVLQHYAGFDMSKNHIAIRTDWVNKTISLKDGKAEAKLNARVYPINVEGMEITFASDAKDIAEIDEDGNITAAAPGTAKIRIVADGEYHTEREVTLNVTQPVTGIYMPNSTVTVYMGSTGQLLETRILPENATNQNVKWKSNDEKIVTVDANGHIKPVALGMTEVTATAEDGNFSAKCYVTVVNFAVNVSSVTIENEYKSDAYLKVGENLNIITAVSPANAKNKTLKWTSSDDKVASVSQTGRVNALSVGKTQITVASVNGIKDTLNLTVQPSDNTTVNGTTIGNSVTNGAVTYTQYDITLADIVNIQMGLDPPPKYDGATKYASREQTEEWMNPSSYCTGAYKYQFLDLSYSNGISEDALNSFLADKGILRGHAADFITAARTYNVSEIYLVAHSCLETGNGTSTLSTGVSVNGETVYNMYGIGAYDNSAVYSGSQKAYKEGWTSVSSAIIGGAQWISNYYINSDDGRQNTLYKMLWNPENPGQHQYATDIEWATQQAINIEKIFRLFPQAIKAYDVPVYNGTAAPAIDTSD